MVIENENNTALIPLDLLQAVESFVLVINRIRQKISFYPPTHPAIPSFLGEAYNELMNLLRVREKISFEFFKDKIIIDEIYEVSHNLHLNAFSLEMYRYGFNSIEFQRSCDKDSFFKFIKLLSLKHLDIISKGGITKQVKDENITGVYVREIDYKKLVEPGTEVVETPESNLESEEKPEDDVLDENKAKNVMNEFFNGKVPPVSENEGVFKRIIDQPDFFLQLVHNKLADIDKGEFKKDEVTSNYPVNPNAFELANKETPEKTLTTLFEKMVTFTKQLPAEFSQPYKRKIANLFCRLNDDDKLRVLTNVKDANQELSAAQFTEEYSLSDFSDVIEELTENEISSILFPLIRSGEDEDFEKLAKISSLLLSDDRKRNLVVFIINYKFKSEGFFNIEQSEKWQNFMDIIESISNDKDFLTGKKEKKSALKKEELYDINNFIKLSEEKEIEDHYSEILIEQLYHLENFKDFIQILGDIEFVLKDSLENKDFELIEKIIFGIKGVIAFGNISNAVIVSHLNEEFGHLNERHLLDALVACARENDNEGYDRLRSIIEYNEYNIGPAIFDRLISEDSRSARRKLISFLVELKNFGRETIALLHRSVNSPIWYVARNAATVLKEIGNERDIPYLENLFAHTDSRVRREAISAVGKIGGEKAFQILFEVVTSDKQLEGLRIIALNYLVPFIDKYDSIIPALRKIIYDSQFTSKNSELKIEAIETLGKIKTNEAIKELINILKKSVFWNRSEWLKYKKTAAQILKKKNLPEPEVESLVNNYI